MPRLLYLYGIVGVDAPAPAGEVTGLEDGPVRLVRSGGIAGIVGEVPAEEYSGEVLDLRLADLAWVGARGVAHERVLTWFADRGSLVPLKPFSLHRSEAAVRERLVEGEAEFRRALTRLAGRREWGIRLWAKEAEVLAHLAEVSPRVRELHEEIRAAAPGRRFLLNRKLEALEADELRASTITVARETYQSLAEAAEAAVRLAIPPPPTERQRFLVLHAAYLVKEAEYDGFERRVSEVAERYGAIGFSCEFTGPWPAYHFAEG